jgi:hypothetical protein
LALRIEGRLPVNRKDLAYHLTVAGTLHNDSQDWGFLRSLMIPAPPLEKFNLGTIDPARGIEIIAAYTRAFFDRHVREQPAPLLSDGNPGFPEVTKVVYEAPGSAASGP